MDYDGGSSDGDAGFHPDSTGSPICFSCLCMCMGLFLWPGALVGTGYNERRSVCRAKALLVAKTEAKDLLCDNNLQTASSEPIKSGELGYLACNIDQTTFKRYTLSSFPSIAQLETVNPALFMNQSAASMTMKTQMYICEEYCREERCTRRLRSGNETYIEQDEKEHTTDPENRIIAQESAGDDDSEEISLYDIVNDTVPNVMYSTPERLLTSSCRKRCVAWGYKLSLKGHVAGVSTFHSPSEAYTACGGSVNPTTMPPPLKLGVQDSHAAAGQVKVVGGAWELNSLQVQNLPCNTPVPLAPRQASNMADPDLTVPTIQPPSQLTQNNTMVQGGILKTCGTPRLGCLEMTFTMAVPNDIRLLGRISSSDPGAFAEEPWLAKGLAVQWQHHPRDVSL